MAIFLRVTAVAQYLALIALGFWLVHVYRDDKAIATGLLVLWGCAPIVVGFALAWGGFAWADRLDSRPCPQCGHSVRLGAYTCPTCGFNLFRRPAPTS